MRRSKLRLAAVSCLTALLLVSQGVAGCGKVDSGVTDADTWKVVLDFDDGKSRDRTLYVVRNESVELPDDPVRDGYAFVGWKTESGEEISQNYTPTQDITLVAQWEIGTCTITYDLDYEGSTPITQTISYGQTVETPPVPDERDGYVFRHWSVSPGGDAVDFANYAINGDYTFYAVWRDEDIQEYTVTFVAGAYEGAPQSSSVTLLQGSTVGNRDVPRISRSGYSLAGWTAEEPEGDDWTIDEYPAKDLPDMVKIPYAPTSSVTLHAVWTIEQYSVIFNVNYTDSDYANGVYSSSKVLSNESVEAPAANPEREGYDFVGWYTLARGGELVDFSGDVRIDATTGYYAHWKHKGVKTDTFQAEYVQFDPNKEYWGYSGSVRGEKCIVPDTGAVGTVMVDNYPTNSVLSGGKGYYVSYQYEKGCTLRFEIISSKATTVSLIGSFAIEGNAVSSIGPTGEYSNLITVNGQSLNYSPISIKNEFSEFNLGSIQLKEGLNVIEIVVNNSSGAMGGTYKAVGFMTDYIRFADYGDAEFTWSPVYDNLEVVQG